jgi:hypothetical protein
VIPELIEIETKRLVRKAERLIEPTGFEGTVVCSVIIGYKSTENSTPRIGIIATLSDDVAFFVPFNDFENYLELVGKDARWTTDIDWKQH